MLLRRSCALCLGLAALLLAAPKPALSTEGDPASLEQRLARAELMAGLTAVEGPGLVVTLRDSPHTVPRGVDKKQLMIREGDVTAVLNALRAGGAEALALEGRGERGTTPLERVLATTALRDDPSGLILNTTLIRAPYRILAIGDARAIRAELFRESGVVKRAGLEDLDMVAVQEDTHLRIPAIRLVPEFRYARAVGEAPDSPRAALPKRGTERPRPPEPARNSDPSAAGESPKRGPSPGRGAETRPPAPTGEETNPPAAPPNPAPRAQTTFFGGKGLAKYHVAGCRFGERIPAGERVTFRSADEARKAGRVPCSICQPAAPRRD